MDRFRKEMANLRDLLTKFNVWFQETKTKLGKAIRDEPLAIMTLIESGVFGFTEYIVPISQAAQVSVLAAVAAFLTISTRKKVSPTHKVEEGIPGALWDKTAKSWEMTG